MPRTSSIAAVSAFAACIMLPAPARADGTPATDMILARAHRSCLAFADGALPGRQTPDTVHTQPMVVKQMQPVALTPVHRVMSDEVMGYSWIQISTKKNTQTRSAAFSPIPAVTLPPPEAREVLGARF